MNLDKIAIRRIEITVTGTEPQSMVMQHQLHLGIGQEHTLSPMLLPSGTSSTLTWYSSNTNVATVSSGKITAVAVGDATITCITENGLREDCEVTVTPMMVSNLSLNQDQLQMSIGDTYQFSTTIAPENATYKQVTWTSINPDVVSVDNNGLMSCLSNGWSVILATTADGSNLTAGCFVQVGGGQGGDVNGDGVVDIKDVTNLIDRLLSGVYSGNNGVNEGSIDDLIS
ncbi:MAG: Ig domain-containing protein [Muribaculaceae bacterium]|nr:Ig domain-containing protein [Muribaculaceae bacterium]